jgi:hypothetical protein
VSGGGGELLLCRLLDGNPILGFGWRCVPCSRSQECENRMCCYKNGDYAICSGACVFHLRLIWDIAKPTEPCFKGPGPFYAFWCMFLCGKGDGGGGGLRYNVITSPLASLGMCMCSNAPLVLLSGGVFGGSMEYCHDV